MANTAKINTLADRPENIGRKPKAFDTLRRIAQRISMEEVDVSEWPLVRASSATLAEAILYTWGYSHDSMLERLFLEVAYGKPPIETRIAGPEGEPIIPPASGFDLSMLSVNELVNLRNIILKAQGVPTKELEEEQLFEEESERRAEESGVAERFISTDE